MKHAQIDTDGAIIAFFDDQLHSTIPEPSVELNDADYASVSVNPRGFRYSTEHVEFRPYTAPQLSLADRKTEVMDGVSRVAADNRRKVAALVPAERLVQWAVKTTFAVLSDVHNGLPSGDATKTALTDVAAQAGQGFGIEAASTGETVSDIRDRTLARAAALFQANQLIEGMERTAEAEIAAVTSFAGLDVVIASLRERQATAESQLAQIIESGDD